MSIRFEKPQFLLSRVFADGSTEELEVLPVQALAPDVGMDRRGALGAGVAISSVLGMLAGCGEPKRTAAPPPPPRPVPEPVVTGSTSGPLKAHKNAISGLTLAPDGKSLVTAAQNEDIKLWGFPSGEFRSPFTNLPATKNGFQTLLLTPDGKRLVTETHDLLSEIEVRSFPEGNSVATLNGHREPVQTLAASADSRILASGSADNTVRLWSLDTNRPLAMLEGHTGPVSGVQVSPMADTLYSGSADGSVRVWSIPDRRYLRTLQPSVAPVGALVLSPDGGTLAAGSRDGSVTLWSVPDGSLRTTTRYHTGPVHSIQISRDGDTVISGGDDGVRKWSISQRRIIDQTDDRFGAIRHILLSPDGLLLLIGTLLGIVILWDVVVWRLRTYFFDRNIAPTTVRGVAYNVFESGRLITYTLPCGSPIPQGATCTCNCVGGTQPVPRPVYQPPPSPPPIRTVPEPPSCACVGNVPAPQRICICNPVCTCVPVCTCLAVLGPG
jgi:WD40 repeat protein